MWMPSNRLRAYLRYRDLGLLHTEVKVIWRVRKGVDSAAILAAFLGDQSLPRAGDSTLALDWGIQLND